MEEKTKVHSQNIKVKNTEAESEDQVRKDIGQMMQFKDRLFTLLRPTFLRIKDQLRSTFPSQIVPSEKQRKLLNLVLRALLALVVFLVVFNLLRKEFFKKAEKKQTPISSQPTAHKIIRPSIYSQDAVVLKLEEEVTQLGKDLDNIQLEETKLRPPSLNFDLDFGE